MVLYFSGTGNTEFVAKQLAAKLGDESLNLLERIRNKDYSMIFSETPWIICAPVYVCEMPRFLRDYLKSAKLIGSKEVYFMFTSGGYMGCSGELAKSLSKKIGLTYKGCSEFIMASNYIIYKRYVMSNSKEIQERIHNVKNQINRVASEIKKRHSLKTRHVFLAEKISVIPVNPIWSKYKMTADKFYATDQCVGCGKCGKVCPLNNISLVDKRPVWGKSCSHCMACICKCPKEAIEYGDKTIGTPRYLLGKYLEEK